MVVSFCTSSPLKKKSTLFSYICMYILLSGKLLDISCLKGSGQWHSLIAKCNSAKQQLILQAARVTSTVKDGWLINIINKENLFPFYYILYSSSLEFYVNCVFLNIRSYFIIRERWTADAWERFVNGGCASQ